MQHVEPIMANVTRLVPARSTEVLTECQKIAAQCLPRALKTVLDKVDDTLFDLANKADNSQRQNLYFDAMRELRLKRESFESSFIDTFNREFENSIDRKKATEPRSIFAAEMELSLVEPDDVEASLALTNFVESMRTKCKDQLFGLDKRMGYLLSEPNLANKDNPIGPTIIGNAFSAACKHLESGIEVKLTLFKLFDKFAGPGIQQMYCDINELLIQRDILPKVTASLRPHGTGRRTRVIIETEDDDGTSLGVDVFSKLQQLMMDPVNEIAKAGSIYRGAANPAPTAQNGFPPLAGPTVEHGVDAADGVAAGGNPNLAEPYATPPIATARFVDTLTLLQHGNLSTLQASSGGNVLDRTQI